MKKNQVKRYLLNIAIGIDQLANTIFAGDPDETISSRLGKWSTQDVGKTRKKIAYVICRMLHWIDKEHCIDSIEEDEGQDAVARDYKEIVGDK